MYPIRANLAISSYCYFKMYPYGEKIKTIVL